MGPGSIGDGFGEGPDGDGAPGAGGINRGRGDAPLVMGDEETDEDAKSEKKDLANKYLNPEDLVDMGITPIHPDPDPGKFSPGTLRDYGEQSGSAVSRTRISPGQKKVVSDYFSE